MKFFGLLPLLPGLAGVMLHGAVPSLVIVTEGDASAFTEALTEQLAGAHVCEVVERPEVARLAAGAGMQTLAPGERPMTLSKLAKADALLFVRGVAKDNKPLLLTLRLTSVADGLVRSNFVLSWSAETEREDARRAAARLEQPLRSLADPQRAKPVPVSLLGLRATTDSPELRAMEAMFNSLLAGSLAAHPELMVAERWRMQDLVFEQATLSQDMPPLPAGAVLVDGSFTAGEEALKVHLRLRQSEVREGTVTEFSGSMDHLLELVESISTAVAKAAGRNAPAKAWKREEEAAAYKELGAWLLEHDMAVDAAQAFESAVALGDVSPAALSGRVRAYAMCAFPDDLMFTHGEDGGWRGRIKPESFEYHLAAALRAVQAAGDFMKATSNRPLSRDWTNEDAPRLGRGVFYTGVRVLRAVHEERAHVRLATLVTPLRKSVARLARLMDASPLRLDDRLLIYEANFAACWCETPEQALAFYRKVLSPAFAQSLPREEAVPREQQLPAWWPVELRRDFTYDPLHGPFFDREVAEDFKTLETGISRLMDWEQESQDRVTTLWKTFIAELKSSGDPQTRADGLCFELQAHHDPANRVRLLAETVEALHANRENILKPGGDLIFASLNSDLRSLARGADHAAAHDRLAQFYLDAYSKSPWVPPVLLWSIWELLDDSLENTSEEECRRLISALDRYEERAKTDPRWTAEYATVVTDARNRLRAPFPALAVEALPPKPANSLVVSRFWNPSRHLTPPEEYPQLDDQTLTVFQDELWFTLNDAVTRLNPATFECRRWNPPDTRNLPREQWFWGLNHVEPTDESVWVGAADSLWRLDRASSAWSLVEMPPGPCGIDSVGGKMFARFPAGGSRGRATGSGLARLGVDDNTPHWIFSSRRRPVEHPLDALPIEDFLGTFSGPHSETWIAVRRARPYCSAVYALERPQSPLLTFGSGLRLKHDGARTLLWEEIGHGSDRGFNLVQAWLVDPSAAKPVLLMHDPKESGLPVDKQVKWAVPELFRQPSPGSQVHFCPVLHGDEIWVLCRNEIASNWRATSFELIGLLPDRAAPLRIPLRISVDPGERATLKGFAPASDVLGSPAIQESGLFATSHGLAFSGSACPGIWFIPWTDLQQWIAVNAPAPSSRTR